MTKRILIIYENHVKSLRHAKFTPSCPRGQSAINECTTSGVVPTDQTKKASSFDEALLCWYGPPGEIRTPDTQVRSLVLYPAELRAEGVQTRLPRRFSQVQRRQNSAISRLTLQIKPAAT